MINLARGQIHEEFRKYQHFIATHPNYEGMPDALNSNSTIQWEAPSNRSVTSKNAHTHSKRLAWWRNKATELGIDTDVAKWQSKAAKLNHPTGKKACKSCGKIMDIRYVYFSKNLLKRLQSIPELEDVARDRFSTIYDLVDVVYETLDKPVEELNKLLRPAQVPEDASSDETKLWLTTTFVPSEPRILSPGAMSNCPDRFDGFHSFNLCCRSGADKGRSTVNLASYASDRRAFENWSAGNWVTANILMGEIRANSRYSEIGCANAGDGSTHSSTISADHIGPISLGFAHRPEFRLLCHSCNSAKNNRLTYHDVEDLKRAANRGETICTWYAEPIWDKYSTEVVDERSASVFFKLLRDNRSVALDLLGSLYSHNFVLPMATLLTPEVAARKWQLENVEVEDFIVRGAFSSTSSTASYRQSQQGRNLRVAFESIKSYVGKVNRNVAGKVEWISLPNSKPVLQAAQEFDRRCLGYAGIDLAVPSGIAIEVPERFSRGAVDKVVTGIRSVRSTEESERFQASLVSYMNEVADVLVAHAGSSRYERDGGFIELDDAYSEY